MSFSLSFIVLVLVIPALGNSLQYPAYDYKFAPVKAWKLSNYTDYKHMMGNNNSRSL